VWAISLLVVIKKHRKAILINALALTLLAAAVSFILPKIYSAQTTILPPETESGLSGLVGTSTGILAQAATTFNLPLMATPSDLYASMLQSETVLTRVVDSLDLTNKYDAASKWAAVSKLRDNIKVEVRPDGIVSIRANADNPELAADIANSMVHALDVIKREIRSSKGREFRQFLETRISTVDSSLNVASNDLRKFQEQHGAIAIDVQAEEMISTIADQASKLTEAEIELEILRHQLSHDHPKVVAQRIRVEEMRRALQRLEKGEVDADDSLALKVELPLSQVPGLNLKLAVLTRNVKVYEKTYEVLLQEYEMARLQEKRDTPTITVLDRARPVKSPTWPSKRVIVVTVFILSLLATITYFVALDAAADESQPFGKFLKSVRDVLHSRSEKTGHSEQD